MICLGRWVKKNFYVGPVRRFFGVLARPLWLAPRLSPQLRQAGGHHRAQQHNHPSDINPYQQNWDRCKRTVNQCVGGNGRKVPAQQGFGGIKTDGNKQTLSYDRFVLATGSTTFMPPIPGLTEYGFSVSTLEDAEKLDQHLKNLANKPANAARNTVVVAGGGLTGLETVTEMPERLRSILGETDVRVVLVDSSTEIGAAMGDQAATVIRE
mgnify:CR=1 FL=1